MRDELEHSTFGLEFLKDTPNVKFDSNVSVHEEAKLVVVIELLSGSSSAYAFGHGEPMTAVRCISEYAAESLVKHLTCLLEVWNKSGRRVNSEKRVILAKDAQKQSKTPQRSREELEASRRSMRRATILRLRETEALAKQLEQQDQDYADARVAEIARQTKARLPKVPTQKHSYKQSSSKS